MFSTLRSIISAIVGRTTSVPSPSILHGRPTQAPTSRHEIRELLASALSEKCSCEICSSAEYSNQATLCPVEHAPTDIIIQPCRQPMLQDPETDLWPYNAMHLARATVRYFTRSIKQFDKYQRMSAAYCRNMFQDEEFMGALNKEDCRNTLNEGLMLILVRNLGQVFFFGEVNVVEFRWGEKDDKSVDTDGPYTMTIHPTAYDEEVGTPRSMQRIGAILHELTRLFLRANSCACCMWASTDNFNQVGRGRAWHIIAKAIEEADHFLLSLDYIDLRRQACLIADVQDNFDRPSLHDIRAYGFADLLEEGA
ncbi:unnamed protein product [Periconia digitata]|uniref:Uncharacterized protein n=1 Tax=Periconia digitata TaxID=1303443 RepID=A0A9W4XYJ7_9PLEO|nr:unnamed protein product [Periconia digitata]